MSAFFLSKIVWTTPIIRVSDETPSNPFYPRGLRHISRRSPEIFANSGLSSVGEKQRVVTSQYGSSEASESSSLSSRTTCSFSCWCLSCSRANCSATFWCTSFLTAFCFTKPGLLLRPDVTLRAVVDRPSPAKPSQPVPVTIRLLVDEGRDVSVPARLTASLPWAQDGLPGFVSVSYWSLWDWALLDRWVALAIDE